MSPLQERAVHLKAGGRTHSAIARTLGIHRSTINGWLHLPPFVAALSELRTEAHIASREALLSGAQAAIHATVESMQVMVAVVQGDAVALSPDDVRLQAAGERYNVVLDPRLQIQAARVVGQLGRTLMDRAGFHSKSELHLSGGGGVVLDLSGEDLDDLEAGLEDDLATLEASQGRLRLLENDE